MSDSFQRNVIFATLLLSIFCGSLVCTSLVTNHWIESSPWRKLNPFESSGHINFGLLYGRKELNVAFGLRPYNITVSDMIQRNPKLMSWSLWCITLVSTCIALISTGFAAFLSIINLVTTPGTKIFSYFGIFLINCVSFFMCLTSSCTWFIQFYAKLYKNVLPKEDIDNFWTSNGRSALGFSFWLIVIASLIHLVNILLIRWSIIKSKRKHQKPIKSLGEKSVGAIMLY